MACGTVLGFLQGINALPAEAHASANYKKAAGARVDICKYRIDLEVVRAQDAQAQKMMRAQKARGVRFRAPHNVPQNVLHSVPAERIAEVRGYLAAVDLILDCFAKGKCA